MRFGSDKRIEFRLPDTDAGIARHAPVASGRECDRADLRTVGQAAALELLLEEAAVEVFEPVQQHLIGVPLAKRSFRQMVDLRGREASS